MGTIKNIDWNNTKCFKTWNYKHVHEDVGNLIIDAIAVLIGEYEAYRKQAAGLSHLILSKAKKVRTC